MRTATFMFVCSLFCVIFLSAITQAQNSLTHNTGTLEVTIIDNGYWGENGSGTYGGVIFNGNQNALYTGGFIYGEYGLGGGNFGIGLIEDLYNVVPITGFFSDTYFNEIAYHTFALISFPSSRTSVKSCSNTGHDFIFIRAGVSNETTFIDDFYAGFFADWDVNNYLLNRGGYVPSKNLFYVYDNGGGTDGSYYGVMGIAINGVAMAPNTMMGSITDRTYWPSGDSSRPLIYNYMTSTAFDTITTDGDQRMFVSVGPFFIPAGSTLEVDLAIVAGTSLADLQDNADTAFAYGPYIPVELTSFTATSRSGEVYLNWATASETNNLGFEIERKILNNQNEGEWARIGFVEGYGTTTEPKEYSYVDNISRINATSLAYRLKQLDFDGSYEYSDEVLVDNSVPVDYALHQNYPNPFNPVTTISYSLPLKSQVDLVIHNLLGEKVIQLVNEEKEVGKHSIEFNATSLPSGVYFYRLQAGSFVETKKMVLMK
jgi:hypothetical protein